jgi:hypothetical protein
VSGVLQLLFIIAIAVLSRKADRGPAVKFNHYRSPCRGLGI